MKKSKRSLTVLYPVSCRRISSPTPAYPRVHFTVGYELNARNRKPITEGQSVSAIFICLKTKSHVWRALLKFLNLRPAHPRHL